MPQYFTKDPNATLDYQNSWVDYLDGDTISTSTWIVPTGITEASSTNTTTTATIWVSGGTDGTTYELVNRIVTTAGRTDDKSIFISVVSVELGEYVARLRRMVNEPTEETYTDGVLVEYIKRYALVDKLGTSPDYISNIYVADAPTFTVNPSWIATYDLNQAAADVWQEKAAAIACRYDFSSGNTKYSRSQAYAQYMQQARYYRSRRQPNAVDLTVWSGYPTERDSLVINAPWVD